MFWVDDEVADLEVEKNVKLLDVQKLGRSIVNWLYPALFCFLRCSGYVALIFELGVTEVDVNLSI